MAVDKLGFQLIATGKYVYSTNSVILPLKAFKFKYSL